MTYFGSGCENGTEGEAAGSMFEEGISGREVSANPRSLPLPSPAVVLSPELELLASTLPALAGLALSTRSFSVCGAFGGHSWNASTRAAKTTVPKTPVASQTVSRLNLLIVSLFTGAICRIDTVDFLTGYPGFSTQVTPLKNESGRTRSRGAQLIQEFVYLLRPDYIGLPFGVAAKIGIGFQKLKWRCT